MVTIRPVSHPAFGVQYRPPAPHDLRRARRSPRSWAAPWRPPRSPRFPRSPSPYGVPIGRMNRFEPQRFWVRGARRVDAFWTTRTSGFTNENRVRTRFSICEGCHHVPGLLRHPCTRSTSSPMYPVYFVTHVPGLLRHPCTRSAPLRVVEIASC